MIHKRETEADLSKQKRLLNVLSKHFGVSYIQFPSFSKKYRIDAFLYDKHTANVFGWVECKWYSKDAHLYLNIPKFNELVQLSIMSRIPSYLLFREHKKCGYIMIANGVECCCDYKVIVGGGTPKGRKKNDDDIEPLVKIYRDNLIWVI